MAGVAACACDVRPHLARAPSQSIIHPQMSPDPRTATPHTAPSLSISWHRMHAWVARPRPRRADHPTIRPQPTHQTQH